MNSDVNEMLNEIERGFVPTLSEVRKHFAITKLRDARGRERTPLIGEERAALQTFLHLVMSERPVLVMAYSGTGKSIMVDAVMDLIPEAWKFDIQMGSDTSPWYNARKINASKFIEFPELQKATQNAAILEILKNWGEGKDAKREVTDIISEKQGGDAVDEQILEWKPFITSVAIGNKGAKDIIYDEEFLRRVMEVRTDPSSQMTKRVVKYKLLQWARGANERATEPVEFELLKKHIVDVVTNAPNKFSNPAGEYFDCIVPSVLPISRSFVDNWISICNAVARFYYKSGIVEEGIIHVRPCDMYEAQQIYLQDFIEGCLKLPLLGREILSMFPTYEEAVRESVDDDYPEHLKFTSKDVARHLETQGFVIDTRAITRILTHLSLNHFLRVDEEGKPKMYYRSEYISNFESVVDWNEVVHVCRANSSNDEYIAKFCGDVIEASCPLTGNCVDIMKLNKRAMCNSEVEKYESIDDNKFF